MVFILIIQTNAIRTYGKNSAWNDKYDEFRQAAQNDCAQRVARGKVSDVEKIIKSTGFYHVKARRIIEVASIIDSQYHGQVPDNLDELLKLPGVGRKTANCVLVYAFEKPAIPVDTHVQ